MPNLFLNVYKEVADFSDKNPKISKSNIRSYQYAFPRLTYSDIDNLYGTILSIKGDWASLRYNLFNANYYVDIMLIFFSEDLYPQESIIIDEIINKCNDFIIQNNACEVNYNYDNLNDIGEKAFDEGLVLSLSEDGGGVIDFETVKQVLDETQIDYRVINEEKSIFDGGVSGGGEEFIAFLSASIASGITWDMIKMALAYKLGINVDRIIINCLDNVKFKVFRKEIADKLGEKSKDLYLKRFTEERYKLIFIFGYKDKEVEVVCDKDYKIKKFEINET